MVMVSRTIGFISLEDVECIGICHFEIVNVLQHLITLTVDAPYQQPLLCPMKT